MPFSSYLFGDQIIWIMFAFAGALWLSSKIVSGNVPTVPVLFGAGLLFTIFMTDFATLLAQDLIIGAGILALVVIVTQSLFKMSLQSSFITVVFAWIVGEMLIGAIQGSLNIFNPWV